MNAPDDPEKPTTYDRATALLHDREHGPAFCALLISATTLIFGAVAAASATAVLVGVASHGWAAFIALCGFAGGCAITWQFLAIDDKARNLLWRFEHPTPTMPAMARLPAMPVMPPHPLLASPDGHPLISLAQMRDSYSSNFGEPRRSMALELIDGYEAWRAEAVACGLAANLTAESLERSKVIHDAIGRMLAASIFDGAETDLDTMYDILVQMEPKSETIDDAIACICALATWCDQRMPLRPWTEADYGRVQAVAETVHDLAYALFNEYVADHPEVAAAVKSLHAPIARVS